MMFSSKFESAVLQVEHLNSADPEVRIVRLDPELERIENLGFEPEGHTEHLGLEPEEHIENLGSELEEHTGCFDPEQVEHKNYIAPVEHRMFPVKQLQDYNSDQLQPLEVYLIHN